MKQISLRLIASGLTLLPVFCRAQINTGSDGHDGAFNPTQSLFINMADHPNGVYQYTSVNVPVGVNVQFSANVNNKPVVWLVQSNCVISGTVNISGQSALYEGPPGAAGPGGGRGGTSGTLASDGQGLGGGPKGSYGGNASYATVGAYDPGFHTPPRPTYGNIYLFPLLGGSGGGGAYGWKGGGGGGGGAILIAASDTVTVNGSVLALGGNGGNGCGGGSGGGVRIVATRIKGNGVVNAAGGAPANFGNLQAGLGRVRFDSFANDFTGTVNGSFSKGFQPVIVPTSIQPGDLAIVSVGGISVSLLPDGNIVMPDIILSGQQSNPIPVVVQCSNLPLNSPVKVIVKPVDGAAVTAVGLNNSGTEASSRATILVNMPRGGGSIYATAAKGN